MEDVRWAGAPGLTDGDRERIALRFCGALRRRNRRKIHFVRATALDEKTATGVVCWLDSHTSVHPATIANRCGSPRPDLEYCHLLDGAHARQHASGRHVLVDRGGPRQISYEPRALVERTDFPRARHGGGMARP